MAGLLEGHEVRGGGYADLAPALLRGLDYGLTTSVIIGDTRLSLYGGLSMLFAGRCVTGAVRNNHL